SIKSNKKNPVAIFRLWDRVSFSTQISGQKLPPYINRSWAPVPSYIIATLTHASDSGQEVLMSQVFCLGDQQGKYFFPSTSKDASKTFRNHGSLAAILDVCKSTKKFASNRTSLRVEATLVFPHM